MASALTGAGERPALLEIALGPVQGFISQSRSTSDLWAGSHLLARAAWEAMRPVVERLGPDAVILPSLRGIPLVDRWLAEQGVVFEPEPQWRQEKSDANPLFSAAVPNRFIVIAPRTKPRTSPRTPPGRCGSGSSPGPVLLPGESAMAP